MFTSAARHYFSHFYVVVFCRTSSSAFCYAWYDKCIVVKLMRTRQALSFFTFRFAICYLPSVCLSVCLFVCNVRAPYAADWDFRQFFFAVWYLGHPLTSTENFTEIVSGNILKAISRKRCKIGEMALILRYFTEFGSFCVNVVDKAITMDNLRLLCLVVNVCRGTERRPLYKYCITTRWKFCSRFINLRLNAQYLPSYRLIC